MVHYIDGFPDREIEVQGKKFLYFGGTSYLGLQTEEKFRTIFINNIKKYGTNYGASRKSNVRLSIYEKAEALLSNIVGSEAALTLSSGYLAGQFIAQSFNKPEYELFYAPNTHSALYNNYNKPHATFADLNSTIRAHLAINRKIQPVVFLDSIDFEGGNYPDFQGLKDLPLEKIILIADDSHGIGIIGEKGEGVFRQLQKFAVKELIVCCSLGKSYGIQAGAVLGSVKRILRLSNTAFFGGASPAGPASIATFIESQAIYSSKRELLQTNIELFKKSVHNIAYFKRMKGHPTFTFIDPQLTDNLENSGFIFTHFNYPEESSSLMSRIVVSSHHTPEDIKLLSDKLNLLI